MRVWRSTLAIAAWVVTAATATAPAKQPPLPPPDIRFSFPHQVEAIPALKALLDARDAAFRSSFTAQARADAGPAAYGQSSRSRQG